MGSIPGILLFADKEIAGLDITRGLKRYHNNESTYLKILRAYSISMRSSLSMIGDISEAGIAGNLHEYKIQVHGIKGSSLGVFAKPVGLEAGMLEDAANDGDVDYINEKNKDFIRTAERLIDDIESVLLIIEREVSRALDKPFKNTPEDESLGKLLSACEIYDMNSAEEILDEIEVFQYSADEGLVSWLRENLNMMNFSGVVKRLRAVKGGDSSIRSG